MEIKMIPPAVAFTKYFSYEFFSTDAQPRPAPHQSLAVSQISELAIPDKLCSPSSGVIAIERALWLDGLESEFASRIKRSMISVIKPYYEEDQRAALFLQMPDKSVQVGHASARAVFACVWKFVMERLDDDSALYSGVSRSFRPLVCSFRHSVSSLRPCKTGYTSYGCLIQPLFTDTRFEKRCPFPMAEHITPADASKPITPEMRLTALSLFFCAWWNTLDSLLPHFHFDGLLSFFIHSAFRSSPPPLPALSSVSAFTPLRHTKSIFQLLEIWADLARPLLAVQTLQSIHSNPIPSPVNHVHSKVTDHVPGTSEWGFGEFLSRAALTDPVCRPTESLTVREELRSVRVPVRFRCIGYVQERLSQTLQFAEADRVGRFFAMLETDRKQTPACVEFNEHSLNEYQVRLQIGRGIAGNLNLSGDEARSLCCVVSYRRSTLELPNVCVVVVMDINLFAALNFCDEFKYRESIAKDKFKQPVKDRWAPLAMLAVYFLCSGDAMLARAHRFFRDSLRSILYRAPRRDDKNPSDLHLSVDPAFESTTVSMRWGDSPSSWDDAHLLLKDTVVLEWRQFFRAGENSFMNGLLEDAKSRVTKDDKGSVFLRLPKDLVFRRGPNGRRDTAGLYDSFMIPDPSDAPFERPGPTEKRDWMGNPAFIATLNAKWAKPFKWEYFPEPPIAAGAPVDTGPPKAYVVDLKTDDQVYTGPQYEPSAFEDEPLPPPPPPPPPPIPAVRRSIITDSPPSPPRGPARVRAPRPAVQARLWAAKSVKPTTAAAAASKPSVPEFF